MEIAEHCHVSAGKCHACHGGHAYDLRRAGRCLWMERGTFAGEVGRQNGRDSAGFLCRRRSQCECGKDVLFSAVREKNYEEMIRILCQEKSVSEYVITLIEDKRAAQTEELKQIFQKYTDKPVVVKEELHQALTYLFSRKAGKAVYCLGSLYLTGMIKAITEEAG